MGWGFHLGLDCGVETQQVPPLRFASVGMTISLNEGKHQKRVADLPGVQVKEWNEHGKAVFESGPDGPRPKFSPAREGWCL